MVEWRILSEGEAMSRLCMAFASAEWPITGGAPVPSSCFVRGARRGDKVHARAGATSGRGGLPVNDRSAAGKRI